MNGELDLYQEAIKQLANAAHGHGQLGAATGEAKLNNPLCGDRVRMQVRVEAGRIVELAHETRGCLLCRAAASLLGQRGVGLAAADVDAAAATLEARLAQNAEAPSGWPEFEAFNPARAHPSRHKCLLLPFRALQAALKSDAAP